MKLWLCSILTFWVTLHSPAGDWPTLRGDVQRTGHVAGKLPDSLEIVWVRHFQGERIGSAVEPIVSEGRLFVGTHQGNLYALDAATGRPLWRFSAAGAFLHSPAVAQGTVVAACTAGFVYALDATSGRVRWTYESGPGGYAASPTIAEGMVLIGSRQGEFVGLQLKDGQVRWRVNLGAPIRQTAAVADNRVFVTCEDLRCHCLDAVTGQGRWTSSPLRGQTARDYYPVILSDSRRSRVIVRTSPVEHMPRRLTEDRHFLCRQAKVNDRTWRDLENWLRNPEALGNDNLWRSEQEAIRRYLDEQPWAQTFFQLDADTGKSTGVAPVLWIAGCQAVGTPPVVLPEGRLLVLHRSAYGNWNLGVAPLVSLGFLDAEQRIQPVHHRHEMQPPWNTFWGTADESQHFVVVGDQVLIVHQSTLSRFDLKTRSLYPVAGDRDSWGGFRNLPWARNEWNGPGRGGVAVAGGHLYWQTGSRIICLGPATSGSAVDTPIDGRQMISERGPEPSKRDLTREIDAAVAQFLERRWAPLILEPGVGGRVVAFEHSGQVFEVLALAFPHLSDDRRNRVKSFLAEEWQRHPPYSDRAGYPRHQGARREWHPMPESFSRDEGVIPPPHPFGNVDAVWRYAEVCGEWERIRSHWSEIRAVFDDFRKNFQQKDPARSDIYLNRYLAALIALTRMGDQLDDRMTAGEARSLLKKLTELVIARWTRAAERFRLRTSRDIKEWDEFLVQGDDLFTNVRPHRAVLGLFHDLTPEVASFVREQAGSAADRLLELFEQLCPTWYLAHEERQLHFGENLFDTPDFAWDAFRAFHYLRDPKHPPKVTWIDIPACRADLFYIGKLAIAAAKR